MDQLQSNAINPQIPDVHAGLCRIFLFSVFPVGSYGMYGRNISYLEFWRSGAGFITIVIGILLPMSAYLMLKWYRIGRMFYLGSMCLIPLLTLLFDVTQGHFQSVVPGAVLLGLLTAYLCLRKPVKEYFKWPLTT